MFGLRTLCKPRTFQMKPDKSARGWLRATGLTVSLVGLLLVAAACIAPPKPTGESSGASTFTSPPGGAPIVASDQREGYRPFIEDCFVHLPDAYDAVEGNSGTVDATRWR